MKLKISRESYNSSKGYSGWQDLNNILEIKLRNQEVPVKNNPTHGKNQICTHVKSEKVPVEIKVPVKKLKKVCIKPFFRFFYI